MIRAEDVIRDVRTFDSMAYKDFVNEVVLDLRPEFPDYSISAEDIENVQGASYYGLVIMSGSDHHAITINLEQYFEKMRRGQTYRESVGVILNDVKAAVKDKTDALNEHLRDYEWVKEHLAMQLVQPVKNEEMLQKIPFVLWNDFAVIFRIVVDVRTNRRMIVLINNDLLNAYGVTDEELFEDALANAEKNFPAVVADAKKGFPELRALRDGVMYLAECENCEFGAAAMLYKNFMEEMAEKFGCGFYIMAPSSESLILVPETKAIMLETLKMMAMATYESYGEQGLSGKLYYYDLTTGAITDAKYN